MSAPALDGVVHMCYCGSSVFKVLVTFDDYQIATYSTEMYCEACETKFNSPTEMDRPHGN